MTNNSNYKSPLHEFVDVYKDIPNARYFIDMDGVLCDFVSGALAAHGVEITDEIRNSLTAHDLYGPDQSPHVPWKDASSFWGPIAAQKSLFWRSINSLHSMEDIYALFKQLPIERTFILTSPSRNEGCRLGKLQWIADMGIEASVIFEKKKWNYVRSENDILLDDNHINIKRWRAAGGTAMCYKQPWNLDIEVHAKPVPLENIIAEVFQKYDSTLYQLGDE